MSWIYLQCSCAIRGGAKYGRYAYDCCLGTPVDSDSFAVDLVWSMGEFLKTRLGGLGFRTKLIDRRGIYLGVLFRLPPTSSPTSPV